MKRKISTAVLFVLTILTVVAIAHIDAPTDTTVGRTSTTRQTVN